MMENKYDIYISYRRDDGWSFATTLQAILSQRGYKVYFQVDRWSTGRCSEESFNAIRSSSVIVMLLTPEYIEGLCNPYHYVNEEMTFVIQENKKIISIVPEEFDYRIPLLLRDVPSAFQDVVTNPFVMRFKGRLVSIDSVDKLIEENIKPLLSAIDSIDLLKSYKPRYVDYDIFISYRREDGRESARNIQLGLLVKGYKKVFFDFESIQEGEFTKRIIDAIHSCNDFILVLSPKSMLRCGEKGDPVANEIRTALYYKKNIIPLTLDNKPVVWPDTFPEDLEIIKGIHYHDHKSDAYFFDSIESLCSRLTTKLEQE